MIYVFLAPGFEEIEALAVVDVLRRAELQVITVGVGEDFVVGSHQIPVAADIYERDLILDEKVEMYSFCEDYEYIAMGNVGEIFRILKRDEEIVCIDFYIVD